jgi:hypothetical protein
MEDAAMAVDTLVPQTRRALLAGALGGVAATIAAALGRPAQADAAAGSPIIMGSSTNNAGTSNTILTTNSTVTAFQLIQNGGGTSLMGYVTPATGPTRGVYGRSNSSNGDGVQGRNAGAAGTGAAIRGYGGNNNGVYGTSDNVNMYGVVGINTAINGDGVAGSSGTGGSGVIGFSTGGNGVYGTSDTYGVRANSTSGVALWSDGAAKFSKYLDVSEITDPGNPGSGIARIFARHVGGSTELVVEFSDTSIVVIATQPIP